MLGGLQNTMKNRVNFQRSPQDPFKIFQDLSRSFQDLLKIFSRSSQDPPRFPSFSLKVDSVFYRIFEILLTCHFTSILHPFPNIFVRILGESRGILKGFGGDLDGSGRDLEGILKDLERN